MRKEGRYAAATCVKPTNIRERRTVNSPPESSLHRFRGSSALSVFYLKALFLAVFLFGDGAG
jgi:hypothetical protein